jgi:N-acylneuraminate cytidylyltransferase/CMP-N,N'-diacetyllegionaminic acid synthase
MNTGETNIVGAICARGGSKGIPRKNLRPLAGKPLIAHAIECAQACSVLRRVVVSTDDHAIANVAEEHGAEVPFIRPADLAQDDTSKWQVFRHLVKFLEERDGRQVGVLVDLDTGVPLRTPTDVTRCVTQLLSGDADLVVTAYEADRNPYFNMVELNGEGLARIVKSSDRPIVCRQAAPPVYSLSPAVYAIRRHALWEYEHWSEAKFQICPLPRERTIDIDTEFDFHLVEFLMQQQGTRNE